MYKIFVVLPRFWKHGIPSSNLVVSGQSPVLHPVKLSIYTCNSFTHSLQLKKLLDGVLKWFMMIIVYVISYIQGFDIHQRFEGKHYLIKKKEKESQQSSTIKKMTKKKKNGKICLKTIFSITSFNYFSCHWHTMQMIINEILTLKRGAIAALYDFSFSDQPIPFVYLHLSTLMWVIFLWLCIPLLHIYSLQNL
jgi:hypothetical protein